MGMSSTLVVIDDDPSVRALVRLYLAASGWEVLEASDALAGRYLVAAARPDLVICDMHMPRMTGLELLSELKSDPSTCDIPVMLLTADEDAGTLAVTRGAAGWLAKPVSAEPLLRVAAARQRECS